MSHWSYTRCADCTGGRRQVMPDGPVNARIAFVGEGPGFNEDREGIPFCGQSGQEQNETYFRLAGLKRSQVFVSNAVQCRQERGGVDIRPDPKLVSCCAANHLQEELWTVNPELLILAGATACSLVPGIDLELEHGLPRKCEGPFGWSGWVVPMYHPAAGMHETRYMTPLLEDWERLGKWLKDEWAPPSDDVEQLIGVDYRLIQPHSLTGLTYSNTKNWWLPIDTETDEGIPYSIQFSLKPGQARMILANDQVSLGWFKSLLPAFDGVVLHNAAYDLEVLERLGIHVTKFRDTMQELYHLGNLPQGLKAAVYRIFGYRMTSYDEVVTPASKRALENWLAEALAHVSASMRTEVHTQLKTKVRVDIKPHEAEAVISRVMRHMHKHVHGFPLDDWSDYDPWQQPTYSKGGEKVRLIGRDWLEEIEQVVGRMPRKSIIHAPMDQQITYACSDADFTGRLAAWLDGERKRIVQEEWRVA